MRLSPIITPNFTTQYTKNLHQKISFGQQDPINSHELITPQKTRKNIINTIFVKMKEEFTQSTAWVNDKYKKSVNYFKSISNKSTTDVAKTEKQQGNENNNLQIPEFKPSFDIVLLKNIVEEKPEITEAWVKSHPKSILTILNATNSIVLGKEARYESIEEFKELFSTSAMQATMIKILLNLPDVIENAENKIKAEKKQYIDSIWQEYLHVDLPYVKFNKEKNILGLKALQKYGTTEDLRRLPRHYTNCKDSDIFLEYAKLVNKVGSDKADDIHYSDFVNLDACVTKRNRGVYSMDVMEEIMDAMKKHWVDNAPKGNWTNSRWSTLKDYEHYIRKAQEEGRPQMEKNARAIFDRIVEDNPWMANKVAREMPQYVKK